MSGSVASVGRLKQHGHLGLNVGNLIPEVQYGMESLQNNGQYFSTENPTSLLKGFSYLIGLLLNLSDELELQFLQCCCQPVKLVGVLLHPAVERLHLLPHHPLPVLIVLQLLLSEECSSFTDLRRQR